MKSINRGDCPVTAIALIMVVIITITAVEATTCACSTGPRFWRNLRIMVQCTKPCPDIQRTAPLHKAGITAEKAKTTLIR